jgi:large subunit ribosomal protein L1
MDLKSVTEKVKQAREDSKKRNFKQTFDCIINLQNLDLKKPEHKVDLGVVISTPVKASKLKFCAVIDHSITGAEKGVDKVLYAEDLAAMKGNMSEIRKITHGYDKFLVQANLMPQFAQVLGRYLGPMGKMPSPKLGMVITPKSDLKVLTEKIGKTVHLQTKKNLVLQFSIGSENESDENIAKNVMTVYDALIHVLPGQQNNIKNVGVKLTMGKVVEVQ